MNLQSHVTQLRMRRLNAWREDILTEGRPAPLPERPTEAPIGSAERFAVYEARAARGEQLHHPDDSRMIYSTEADARRARRRTAERLAAKLKRSVAPSR